MIRRRTRIGKLQLRHALSVALVAVVLFQITVFKYLMGALAVSRTVNLALFSGSLVLSILVVFYDRHPRRVWLVYLLPSLLTAAACSANLFIAIASGADVANQVGLILVMAALLAVPFFHTRGAVDKPRLWRLYYYGMLLIVALGLIEYGLIFAGAYPIRSIQTDGGFFVAGRFSILYATESSELHHRFYGAFPEPGTLAMWLLPAIAYGIIHKRFVGLAVLFTGFFLTYSLGGTISLVILGGALVFSMVRRTRIAVLLIPVVSVVLIWVAYYLGTHYFFDAFQDRGRSASLRSYNLVEMVSNFPALIAEAPFGMLRAASTDELARNRLFYGYTFAISRVFLQGGLLAVIGFTILVVQSALFAGKTILRRTTDNVDLVCAVSLIAMLPFLVQRVTVWESSLFGILFAPSILTYLQHKRSLTWTVLSTPTPPRPLACASSSADPGVPGAVS